MAGPQTQNRKNGSDELEARIEDLERRLDRLRSIYEQYFQGIERIEPSHERTQLHNLILDLRKVSTRNTALRFRINQLVSRLNTFENYWNRITRQIEEGTYHRDVARARYRAQRRTEKPTAEEEMPAESAGGVDQPSQAAGRSPAATPAGADPLGNLNVSALYRALVTAKRRCGESTRGLSEQTLAQTLRKQIPAIKKQYGCNRVAFKVVIKNGRAIIKAVPRD
ncbi:MAG: hypothetical protein D6806_03650 [Deltaproteobacteria bacterium]|nr:MAG: hypothetical protein D6806_03650 [Deltaproteobacteria bacterium]